MQFKQAVRFGCTKADILVDMENADLFDGFGNGSLHMYVVCSRGGSHIKAAVRALRKLIYGCDEAIKAGCSLMFVCD